MNQALETLSKEQLITLVKEQEVQVANYENTVANYENTVANLKFLIDKLNRMLLGSKKENYFSPDISKRVIREIQESESIDDAILKEEPLTEREVEICQLLCQGMTCPIIANQLNRSIRTIENHKSHIFKKFGVGSCTEMMAVAIRRNHFQINI